MRCYVGTICEELAAMTNKADYAVGGPRSRTIPAVALVLMVLLLSQIARAYVALIPGSALCPETEAAECPMHHEAGEICPFVHHSDAASPASPVENDNRSE